MSGRVVYTLHLWPPIAHARHYTGSAMERRLAERLADHALGRGARLTQVQVERGGSWVVGNLQPGGRDRERELKDMHEGSRHCDVCKAVRGHEAGQLTAAEALARAGWDRASQHERSLLLGIFGLSRAPENLPAGQARRLQPAPQSSSGRPYPSLPGSRAAGHGRPDSETHVIPAPRPAADVQHITPEIVALVDQLQATWTAGRQAAAHATALATEPEMEAIP